MPGCLRPKATSIRSKLSRSSGRSFRICCSASNVASRRTSQGTFFCLARSISSRQESLCRSGTETTGPLLLTAFTLAATIFAFALAFAVLTLLTLVLLTLLLAFVFVLLLLVLFLLLRSRQSAKRNHEGGVERFGAVAPEYYSYRVRPWDA